MATIALQPTSRVQGGRRIASVYGQPIPHDKRRNASARLAERIVKESGLQPE
jgi:hypothetical protein